LANGRINKRIGTAKQETVVRTDRPIVVDATDHIAGRLASNVAKLLIKGNRVSVVNCEKIMMSGTRSNHIQEYREFLEINSIINYKHGPKHYRRPDTVMAKMIRQMLPFDRKPSGKESFQRLRTYIGSPKEIKSIEKIQFEKAKIRKTAKNSIKLYTIRRAMQSNRVD
jgi:large subunit ribosomal protein L13